MSTTSIEKVTSLAINANEIFSKLYEQSLTSLSFTANAVLIDCQLSQKRLALMTIDEIPGVLGVAIGAKGTDEAEMLSQLPMATLTSSSILAIMQQHLAHKPV